VIVQGLLSLLLLAAVMAAGSVIASWLVRPLRQFIPLFTAGAGLLSLAACIAFLAQISQAPLYNHVLDVGFWVSFFSAYGLAARVFLPRKDATVALRARFAFIALLWLCGVTTYALMMQAQIARLQAGDSVWFETMLMIVFLLYGVVVGFGLTGTIFQRKGHSLWLGRGLGLLIGAFGSLPLLFALWVYTPTLPDRQTQRLKLDEIIWALIFLLPWVTGFLVFTLYPMIDSYRVALYNWRGIGEATQFVGLRHIQTVARDPIFWTSFWNTVRYTATLVPLQLSLCLVLAVILNRRTMRFKAFYRTIYFMPVVTSVAVVAVVMRLMLTNFGQGVSELLNINPPVDPLSSPQLAMLCVILFGTWHSFGVNLVYFLAALQTVPEELYDAARVDGANWWQELINITLPSIRPVSMVILTLAIIGSMNVFEQSFVLTRGNPYFASQVVSGYIYNYTFTVPGTRLTPNLGYSSAAALFFGFIMIGVTLLNFFVARRMQRQEN
jgi:ABC-type sugar transport system permease subunit